MIGEINCMIFICCDMESFEAAAFLGCDIRNCRKVARAARIGRIWVGSGAPSEKCKLGLIKVNQFKSILGK